MSELLRWAEIILKSESAIIILLLIALFWFNRQSLKDKKEIKKLYEKIENITLEKSKSFDLLLGILIDEKLSKKISVKKKNRKAQKNNSI